MAGMTTDISNPFFTADIGQTAADTDLSFRDCGTITYHAQGAILHCNANNSYL